MNFTKNRRLSFALLTFAAILLLPSTKADAAAGDLYQVNPFGGAIYKYTPAGARTLFAAGLASTPNNLAFNGAGELFVNEGSGASAKITKITPAGVKTTFASGVEANGLACDAAGNLFVSDGLSQSILKFTPAGEKSTFAPGVNTLALVFGGGFGGPYLYAADFGAAPGNPTGPGIDGQGKVYVFDAAGTKATATSGLNRPKQLATDGYYLYVGTADGLVLRYDLFVGGGNPYATFASGLGNIQGMACDSAGNLFVSTSQSIVKITPAKVKTDFVAANNPSGLAFEPPRDLALNISTRLGVQTGENALIAGFIIRGPDYKGVIVRGLGPSLTKAQVAGALQDPTIEMHFPTGVVITNDNWKDGEDASIIAAGQFAPSDDRESALGFDLPPGSYSVIERGVGNETGVGLLEVYDVAHSENSSLANISTRGFVGTGDNVMIGGFITGGGNGAAKVVVRAIGPSLSAFGIQNPLADPMVELRDKNGAVLVANDNWVEGAGDLEIEQLHLEPSNNVEAAVIATLTPGNYTAIVSGKNGGTGVGLVEVYNIQ
jgi:sugar lactone lactonase YvrE